MDVILSAALPVLLTVLVGFFISKFNRPFDKKTITFIVGTIGTPVLIFYSLTHTTATPESLAIIGGATLVSIACFLIIGMICLKVAGLSFSAYLPSLSFPNTGNLGLPLAFYAFGEEGLNYAIAIFAVVAISNHTLGQTIAAGRGKWRNVITNPVISAVFFGILVFVFDVKIPVWLDNTLEILSGLTIPLMLLMLGTSLATIQVTTFKRSTWLALLRIGMGTAVGFGLSSVFGFEGAARGAFILQCSMPVAVYNYVYSQMYNRDPEEVASLIVVSTVFSVITIPLLLSILA
jgi:malate permease and related proteins